MNITYKNSDVKNQKLAYCSTILVGIIEKHTKFCKEKNKWIYFYKAYSLVHFFEFTECIEFHTLKEAKRYVELELSNLITQCIES